MTSLYSNMFPPLNYSLIRSLYLSSSQNWSLKLQDFFLFLFCSPSLYLVDSNSILINYLIFHASCSILHFYAWLCTLHFFFHAPCSTFVHDFARFTLVHAFLPMCRNQLVEWVVCGSLRGRLLKQYLLHSARWYSASLFH